MSAATMTPFVASETVRTVNDERGRKNIVGDRSIRFSRHQNGLDVEIEMDVDGVYIDMILDWRDLMPLSDWLKEASGGNV